MSSDVTLGETIYRLFTTRAFATGIPGTLGGSPVVSAYENDSVTQITAGITLGVDHDSVTGLNLLTLVMTSGNGYESGKDYSFIITTGTVDSVSVVGEVVIEVTIGRSAAAVDLANGTDGLGALLADVLDKLGAVDESAAAGDPSSTESVMQYVKQTVNLLAGAAGIGTNPSAQVPANAVNIFEILNSLSDRMPAALVNSRMDSSLDATGFEAAAVDLIWDEVLTGATHNVSQSSGRRLRGIDEFAGYGLGAIWIDTVNGTAGTVDFENGTVSNPVNSIADANTLSSSLGINRFVVAPGSSITFAASQENQEFLGKNWTLALGGQSISNSHFNGADVTGTGTSSTEAHFDHCEMGTCTLGTAHFDTCDLSGTITISAAATYFFLNCYHAGTVVVDFGSAVGNTTVHIHDYHGAMTISNMGQSGTDVLHFSSPDGNLTLNSNNTGGTVNLNGVFALTNNGSGQTINAAGHINQATVNTEADTALTDYNVKGLLPSALVGGRIDATVDATGMESGAVANILTTQMTESYAANGVAPTLAQAMFATHQMLMQFGIASTSYTVRKLDDSTTAFVVTLNDATLPTDAKRV